MILGERFIRHMIRRGRIKYTAPDALSPASLDVRLGDSFLFVEPQQEIILGGRVLYQHLIATEDNPVVLMPGDFCLGTTMEWVNLPRWISGYVQGRSSIGRSGLCTQNAGFIDPGFRGHITLELKNDSPAPIILKPGYRVAQFVFHRSLGVRRAYSGKYNDQCAATGSRMYLDKIE